MTEEITNEAATEEIKEGLDSDTDDAAENDVPESNDEADDASDKQGLDDSKEVYGSPENYDYSGVELPEGMSLDQDLVNEFNPLAKKYNLSNKSANELMNLAVKLVGKNTPDANKLAAEVQTAEANHYLKELNSDKELNAMSEEDYGEYINTARLGVNSVATNEFKNLLKVKGLSNSPAFIKTFYNIGKLCKTDTFPTGKTPVMKQESAADILYGKKN